MTQLTDEDLTRIYNEANGIDGKNPPITTMRIFAAMRAVAAQYEAKLATAREALLKVARMAEGLKLPCGMDPESPQAIRNGEYMNISYAAREAIAAIGDAQPASAEAKQEPFAYAEYVESPDGVVDVLFYSPLHKPDRPVIALYTQQPRQEPVAWACWPNGSDPKRDKPQLSIEEPSAYTQRRPLIYGDIASWDELLPEVDEALDVLGDAQPASAEAKPIPDGWQLVPKVATEEMVTAIDGVMWPGASEKAYRAMLAAAPTPPHHPRQESEIAADALEEAAGELDKWGAQARLVAKWLRERATQKREQAK